MHAINSVLIRRCVGPIPWRASSGSTLVLTYLLSIMPCGYRAVTKSLHPFLSLVSFKVSQWRFSCDWAPLSRFHSCAPCWFWAHIGLIGLGFCTQHFQLQASSSLWLSPLATGSQAVRGPWRISVQVVGCLRCCFRNASVNSSSAHPPPPPGLTPGN